MLHKDPKKPDSPTQSQAPDKSGLGEQAKQPDDELTQRLRTAVRRKSAWQRFSSALLLPAAIALLIGVVWWVWPREQPPELVVIGFDHVTRSGKQVTVRAATVPHKPGVEKWGGQNLFFQEIGPLLAEGDKPLTLRADEQGLAESPWTVKNPTVVTEIEVVYLEESLRPPWSDRARSRIFTWPPGTRLLVLDVEPTLKNTDNLPALAQALREATAAGWQVVYLAVNADTPLEYAKLRNRVMTHAASKDHGLLNGPVLSRPMMYQSEKEADSRKKVLAALKAEFTGPLLYVTADHGLQLQTVTATGDFTGDPVAVPTWPELVDKLPK